VSASQIVLAPTHVPPSASTVAALSRDYAELSAWMAQLDGEVGSLTRNMAKLNDNTPQQAGLTTLWEEQEKSLRRDKRDGTTLTALGTKVPGTAAIHRSPVDRKNTSDYDELARGNGLQNQ
jgi:hypothetical protein